MNKPPVGISYKGPHWFATPEAGGKWRACIGEIEVVDGYLHKISVPGFEVRSGETFGITGKFHVVGTIGSSQEINGLTETMLVNTRIFTVEGGRAFIGVALWTIENGIVIRTECVTNRGELVELPEGYK